MAMADGRWGRHFTDFTSNFDDDLWTICTGNRKQKEKKDIFPTLADGQHSQLCRRQMADGADTLPTLL